MLTPLLLKTVEHIRAAAATPKQPFFVAAGLRAPHGPETPAPWYKDLFPGQNINTSHPAWNKTGLAGKAKWIKDQPPIFAAEAAKMSKQFVDRWRTLVSVDDLVLAVVNVLAETKLLDNTFIFYSSDQYVLSSLLSSLLYYLLTSARTAAVITSASSAWAAAKATTTNSTAACLCTCADRASTLAR